MCQALGMKNKEDSTYPVLLTDNVYNCLKWISVWKMYDHHLLRAMAA